LTPRGHVASGQAGLEALSASEREIAELVTDRRTNKEIAAQVAVARVA
jgi:DNA-binding CsgD family transcriptional regulator